MHLYSKCINALDLTPDDSIENTQHRHSGIKAVKHTDLNPGPHLNGSNPSESCAGAQGEQTRPQNRMLLEGLWRMKKRNG